MAVMRLGDMNNVRQADVVVCWSVAELIVVIEVQMRLFDDNNIAAVYMLL